MYGPIIVEKLSFKLLGLSLKLDWGTFILSIVMAASKKLEPRLNYRIIDLQLVS